MFQEVSKLSFITVLPRNKASNANRDGNTEVVLQSAARSSQRLFERWEDFFSLSFSPCERFVESRLTADWQMFKTTHISAFFTTSQYFSRD